ncbi:CoA transferase subunit A [Clostridium luticellarii]|jgi:acetate CoA/acetoacetate CoA-transferase alpha subunit|uniref:Butyrate--acetoacetate CoA-transferase subunit A n=1 Tax=Clostridium luticellarii TaxID=1691940 RepID=A0A2T0BSJ3_9CLOT|nr:CoA transferase subunit A [Clostridium luticellarii]MCI1945560.1 CoA transferase subunit A [Clostridium luticellarii]MCI1968881.1 CoA transferase subunit A [Clostridium luticellarii]MCI2041054.1 CoA transferase subunit A [Clostridium luticellarii]PRR86785.1 Butyrate--acetoacetate CoA-transferase subunit A [Clostridium luticellarii]
MPEFLEMEEAIKKYVKDGSDIMIGGFLGSNVPLMAIDKLVKLSIKDLTLICSTNSFPGGGFDVGLLFDHGLVKKFIGSHIGTNPTAVKQYIENKVEVEYCPIGSLVERIRCAAAGLGGVLTPTGVGTLVEKGKKKIKVDKREYLLETPLKADIALIKAQKADKMGNLVYKGTPNASTLMAAAADITIVEVEEIVENGEIKPELVQTPGIFNNVICKGYSCQQYKDKMLKVWSRLR